ncbi:MAG: acyl-CoA dehydrogenase, partial [Vicinamibacteria bacterium]|nr:acyl-CoA dehydrogenase [Vicinamibacteria bacterium]
GCKVPKENVLGEVGKGYKIAIETLNEGRIGIGAQMVGVAQGALDHAVKYSQERVQFGKPIAEFQAISFLLAEMAMQIDAARLLTYNAARLRDVGQPFIKEAAMSKLFASRTAEFVTSKAIEVYGGYGLTREYPVEKYFRDQKVGQIYEGTSNMQLMVIAKQLMGKM